MSSKAPIEPKPEATESSAAVPNPPAEPKTDHHAEFVRLQRIMADGVQRSIHHTDDHSQKNLRVSINTLSVSVTALIDLLIEKDVITAHEFWEMASHGMSEEVADYEKRLSKILQREVKLG